MGISSSLPPSSYGPRPLLPPKPPSKLENLDAQSINLIAAFHPNSLKALRAASRALTHAGDHFLNANKKRITDFCRQSKSEFTNSILKKSVRCELQCWEKKTNSLEFHLLIPEALNEWGVIYPENTILHSIEVIHAGFFINNHQNASLKKIWPRVRLALHNLLPTKAPGLRASAHDIRLWMEDNQLLLQQIAHLDLSKLSLSAVPFELKLFTALRALNLSHNPLWTLPEEIFQKHVRLEILSLKCTRLQKLPPRIFRGLTRLKILNLNGNQLTSFPDKLFRRLPSLEQLSIEFNGMPSFPQELLTLKQLNTLCMAGNPFTSDPDALSEHLPLLKVITFSGKKG